jgi:carbamoyltransferase
LYRPIFNIGGILVYTLGIWDGHDSGAAIVKGDKILVAINEERLTRRKLEIKFPVNSIRECLNHLGLSPVDISEIAVSTSDFAKTLARIFPSTKEEYYQIRRRKKRGSLSAIKKRTKYFLTEFGSSGFSRAISKVSLNSMLKGLGFTTKYNLHLVDHHLCHAAAAAFTSGFDSATILTIDGIGDALSGSISTLSNGVLDRKSAISGKHSLGIFFEHVTNLLNMRELEDEGKVMALANYAYPIPDSENPLLDLIKVDGCDFVARYGSYRMYGELKKLMWKYPSEQFAYMAQRTLEVKILELVKNIMADTGVPNLALSGGVFSNIKVNMLLRKLVTKGKCFVFPHMGDGGLALGAALWLNHQLTGVSNYRLNDLYLGLGYETETIKKVLGASNLEYSHSDDVAGKTAELVAKGNIVFWFQGRMEYGPRALGNRSILAMPNSKRIRDLLNLRLKQRVWYQPFCPSMLEDEAKKYFEDYDEPNRFMTMGYMVKDEKREEIEGVISVDGSARPQVVNPGFGLYGRLLDNLKNLTGRGMVLNTSFNIHGEPMVCSPEDAVKTLIKTKNEYLVMGDFIVRDKG